MALHTSRGYETAAHKAYMRMTVRWAFPRALSRVSARVDTPAGRRRPPQVLALDIAVFFTACLSLANVLEGAERTRTAEDASARQRRMLRRVVLALAAPAPILVDHGHFQYNSVSLGLALHAVAAIARGHEVLGSVLFCAALNFKQMCLYFAPGIFFHLLARCMRRVHRRRGARAVRLVPLLHVAKLGVAVIASFLVLWAPFCVRAAEVSAVCNRSDTCSIGSSHSNAGSSRTRWPTFGALCVPGGLVPCRGKRRCVFGQGTRSPSSHVCARGYHLRRSCAWRSARLSLRLRPGPRSACLPQAHPFRTRLSRRRPRRAHCFSRSRAQRGRSSCSRIKFTRNPCYCRSRRAKHFLADSITSGLVAAARGLDTASIRRVARRSGCFLDVASPHAGWARARLRCLPRFACSSLGALRGGQSTRRAPRHHPSSCASCLPQ